MEAIGQAITSLRQKYARAYGFAVLDLEAREVGGRVRLSGQVLTSNQKTEVLSAVGKVSAREIEDRIRVLSDVRSRELGWAVVKVELADLRSRFVRTALLNERISKRVRTSQVSRGEVLRIIYRQEDQLLVQTGDLSLGWLARSQVTLKQTSLRPSWRAGLFAREGKLVSVRRPAAVVVAEAEKYLGTGYVLGGRSRQGIDCSALTQLAFRDALGVILPRHSWDQKRMGIPVPMAEAATGDLVFMINGDLETKHVGIWEVAGQEHNIIHASSARGQVVRQRAGEVFAKYKPVEVRRIVQG